MLCVWVLLQQTPLLSSHIHRRRQVRTLSARAQQTLVQTLPLRDVRFMAAPPRPVAGEGDGDGETRAQCQGPIFVSSTTSIHRLVQVSEQAPPRPNSARNTTLQAADSRPRRPTLSLPAA